MSSSNHILTQEEQFKAYLEGKLSEQESSVFVKKMESNPFFQDAFEGFKANPGSIQLLPKLKVKSSQFTSSNLVTNFYTLFIVLSIVTGGTYLFNLGEEESIVLKDVSEVPVLEKVNKIKIIAPKPIQELTDKNIDASVLKESKKLVQYDNVIKNHPITILDRAIEDKIETNKVDLIKLEQKPQEQIKKEEHKELVTESVPLISLHGLINVNYSKIENNFKFKKVTVSLTGVPANIEEGGVEKYEPSHELKTEYIPYEEYLKDIQYYFKRNKFKKALKGYKEILKQHPTDINAHFYSALCYYNINQSAKALEHLDVVLLHQYDSFRQEGEWYKAQVLYDLGETEGAVLMLEKIIKRNDFYAIQAVTFKLEIE